MTSPLPSNNNDNNHSKDSTHGKEEEVDPYRYFAYTARFPILVRSFRYLAYTSDLGESFRPIVSKWIVRSSYGISWLYCGVDVALHGLLAKETGGSANDITQVVIKRSLFQTVSSMLLPAVTINLQVKLFQKIFAKVGKWTRWGPTIAGLAVIPLLPVMFDEPTEKGLDYLFNSKWVK